MDNRRELRAGGGGAHGQGSVFGRFPGESNRYREVGAPGGLSHASDSGPGGCGNRVLACPSDKAENGWSQLTTKQSFGDFTLTMRVYVLGDLNGNFGVSLRITGDQSFAVTFNHVWKGQFGYSGGGDIYDDKLVIQEKAWHDVRVIAVGDSYELYIDGELRQKATDAHLKAGPLQLSYWNKAFYIDDFTVYEGRVEEPMGSGGNTAYYLDSAAAPGGDGLTPETAWNSVTPGQPASGLFSRG